MRFAEIKRDLFNVPLDQYKLVHCVSADLVMGAGVAAKMVETHPSECGAVRNWARRQLLEGHIKQQKDLIGKALHHSRGNIFHLVTKEKYNYKPTYEILALALHDMRKDCLRLGYKKLAMPTIGCGLDKLEWSKVRMIIQGIFNDTDIDIVVCHWT